jgi:hypothetical protein
VTASSGAASQTLTVYRIMGGEKLAAMNREDACEDPPDFDIGHRLATLLLRPSTAILAVTILVAQTGCVKPNATAIFCAPSAV